MSQRAISEPNYLDMVAKKVVFAEWEDAQLELADQRALYVETKRELVDALRRLEEKEAEISIANAEKVVQQELVIQMRNELSELKEKCNQQSHRINELAGHVSQRDFQIAQLLSMRAVKLSNLFTKLKRRLFS